MSESVDLSKEKAYLKAIVCKINAELEYINIRVSKIIQHFQEAKKELWQNIYDIDPHEARRTRQLMGEEMDTSEIVLDQQRRLVKLVDSPYFARIDFDHAGEREQIYIGIFSFMDKELTKMLIYDWRAPISSMYYDFELGPSFYEAPDGEIHGEIVLKRQYKTENGQLTYMLESAININDDVLQKELSSTSDEKMKNIVATIQKEQNAIIRNEAANTLIIQGVAGSGKTSIALHRVAFFLYKYKKSLNAKNVLIISPNKVFGDYISNVLPELGEEPIAEISIDEIAENEIDEKLLKFEYFSEQVAYLIENNDEAYIQRIKFKASPNFIVLMDNYIEYYVSAYFKAADIEIKVSEKEYFVSKEFVESRYFAYQRYPVLKRLEETAKDVFEKMQADNGKLLKKPVYIKIQKLTAKMFRYNNLLDIYKDFYVHIAKTEMFIMADKNKLEYSDVFPYIYLKISFEGTRDFHFIKHLLIDEMQDYTPIQMAVLNRLFHCRKTILGDCGQAVNPHILQPAEIYGTIFSNMQYVQLFKSYRSTFEIIHFAKKFKEKLDIEAVERHGEEPKIIKSGSYHQMLDKMKELILEFKGGTFKSMGIVCRTQKEAEALFNKLKDSTQNIHYLDFDSSKFNDGITVTTVHMSKGLEFDQVLIPSVNNDVYFRPMDKNLLYIGCTRAMHSLQLLYYGQPSPFLADEDKVSSPLQ